VRVYVTGASGYIGTPLVAALREAGHEIVGGLSGTPDYVMHLAAASDARGSHAVPLGYYEDNVVGTLNLLQRLTRPYPRFIYASSSVAAFPESSPYAATKAACEHMIFAAAKAYGFEAVALRPFVVAGAMGGYGEAHTPETHLVPKAVQAQLCNAAVPANFAAPGRGAVRDYVHVADVVSAFLAAMTAPSGTYEVGTGQPSSIMDVVEAVGCRVAYGVAAPEPGKLVSDPARWLPGWAPRYGLARIIETDRQWRLTGCATLFRGEQEHERSAQQQR